MFVVSIALEANITPIPSEFKQTSDQFVWVDALKWSCTSEGKNCIDNLKIMMTEYQNIIFPKGDPKPDQVGVSTVDIQIKSLVVPQTPVTTNDNYTLIANTSGFFIAAENTYGVARAVATLSQVIEEPTGFEYKPGKYAFLPCNIADKAAYVYRSVMIDTARHFYPVATVKREILALSITKMNILHIHIVDSQSNAYKPDSKPADEFEKAGYYNGQRYVYTSRDLADFASYAVGLGVFIVIEYDMPGHVQSWRMVNEDLVADCPAHSTVNVLNEDLYIYIEAYLSDVIKTIYNASNQYPLIHLGGDEVDHGCWNADPKIKKYMDDNKINTQILWQQFHTRIQGILRKLHPESMLFYWQESYENGNDFTNSVIHVWYGQGSTNSATSKGIKLIRSLGWYLDLNQPGQSRYMFQDSWKDFYQVHVDQDVAEANKHLVLGGGGCMWSEKYSEANVEEQIWPRAVAIGEILWSNPVDRNADAAAARLKIFTCKLISGGIGSGPIREGRPCPGFESPKFD